MTDRIYLDNAATTPMHPSVIDVMTDVLRNNYGNPSSIHQLGRQSKTIIEEARKVVANYLNASIGEIFFTSGGTEATNTALKCAVRDLGITRIISSPIEHHCVGHSLDSLRLTNEVDVELVELEACGRPDMQDLQRLLAESDRPTLVSLMHANNEIGTMIDLVAVGDICRDHGALFHSDTVQTFAQFPFDLENQSVDFITGSAHKFYGPKGTGILYIRQSNQIKPLLDGGGQERNMRAGTENIAGIAGLAKALQVTQDFKQKQPNHVRELRNYMLNRLQDVVPDIVAHGDPTGLSLDTVLNVGFPSLSKDDLLLLNLDIAGISASGGSACTSGADTGSHVISHLYPAFKGSAVRFSFSIYNTRDEIDRAIEVIRKIVSD